MNKFALTTALVFFTIPAMANDSAAYVQCLANAKSSFESKANTINQRFYRERAACFKLRIPTLEDCFAEAEGKQYERMFEAEKAYHAEKQTCETLKSN